VHVAALHLIAIGDRQAAIATYRWAYKVNISYIVHLLNCKYYSFSMS
jgi:hypothetical protein